MMVLETVLQSSFTALHAPLLCCFSKQLMKNYVPHLLSLFLMVCVCVLQIESDLKELSVILCLGAKETNEIRSDVAGALYKKLLREEVTSRRIDAAASPAQASFGRIICSSQLQKH